MLLSAGETLDGLGLAETTPGPLILVTSSWVSSPAFIAGTLVLTAAAALTSRRHRVI